MSGVFSFLFHNVFVGRRSSFRLEDFPGFGCITGVSGGHSLLPEDVGQRV